MSSGIGGESLPSFTFAVIGHNESDTLESALGQATAAASSGDQVWFVDSASTDDSRHKAKAFSCRVVDAPIGKGRAMRAAMAECETDYLCFSDADIVSSERNISATLRDATIRDPADLVVGQFWDTRRSVLIGTLGIYVPMIEAFFPDIADRYGTRPLSGFRVVRRQTLPRIPDDFGVEAHLNIEVVMAGGSSLVADIGHYEGRYSRKLYMGREIASAILDSAERHGRIQQVQRLAWEEWVAGILNIFEDYNGRERAMYRRRLFEALARPRPDVGKLVPAIRRTACGPE